MKAKCKINEKLVSDCLTLAVTRGKNVRQVCDELQRYLTMGGAGFAEEFIETEKVLECYLATGKLRSRRKR